MGDRVDVGRVSRRGFLVGASGLLAAGCRREPVEPLPQPPRAATSAAAPVGPVTVFRALSYARGRDVRVVMYRPEDVDRVGLPVCLAFHGNGEDADVFGRLGVVEALTQLSRSGEMPFAVAAVDGGGSSWTPTGADDPGRMLSEEVPGWLSRHGLASTPFGALGIGEGAYGALAYASNPGLAAVAVLDPTLFTTWSEARTRGGMATEETWRAADPLRRASRLVRLPLGVWSPSEDPGIRRVADELKARTVTVGEGGPAYRGRALPEVLRFLGDHGERVGDGY
ncbi:esterase [Actinokineospora xionganensis]|uniref:Esterase n=1 Tax=Actinokineospora xionganensis TaxID=2684470 RepID=A0ABR7L4N7_9PSEU|nr:esterase [Actinokineospora xionganensis]MBC6447394.1 esterase [Actinokineospora xionganensis]